MPLMEMGLDVLVESPWRKPWRKQTRCWNRQRHRRVLQVGTVERFNPGAGGRAILNHPLFFEVHG